MTSAGRTIRSRVSAASQYCPWMAASIVGKPVGELMYPLASQFGYPIGLKLAVPKRGAHGGWGHDPQKSRNTVLVPPQMVDFAPGPPKANAATARTRVPSRNAGIANPENDMIRDA